MVPPGIASIVSVFVPIACPSAMTKLVRSSLMGVCPLAGMPSEASAFRNDARESPENWLESYRNM